MELLNRNNIKTQKNMKQRIKEIMDELWETHLLFKNSRPETEQGYLILNYNTLFVEAVSCYRGEQTEKNKKTFKKNITKPATNKQIAYVQKLADQKGINITITGNETSEKISKLIGELQQ